MITQYSIKIPIWISYIVFTVETQQHGWPEAPIPASSDLTALERHGVVCSSNASIGLHGRHQVLSSRFEPALLPMIRYLVFQILRKLVLRDLVAQATIREMYDTANFFRLPMRY